MRFIEWFFGPRWFWNIKIHWGAPDDASVAFRGGAVCREMEGLYGLSIRSKFFGFMALSSKYRDIRKIVTKKAA